MVKLWLAFALVCLVDGDGKNLDISATNSISENSTLNTST